MPTNADEALRRRGAVVSDDDTADEGWPSWIWWAGGIFLLLAYCNYSERDRRAAPANPTLGMTSAQAARYQDCMSRSGGYNLSDYTLSEMCRRSALDLDSDLECGTEWDGRANPTVCN